MKKIYQLLLVALAAGTLFGACSKTDDSETDSMSVSLVSISADARFSGNSASVTATLSKAIENPVSITLGYGANLTDSKYGVIAADDLTYSTITIPAGSTEGTGSVTVDPSSYTKGRYQTEVCITSISGAAVSQSKDRANITLVNGLPLASIEVDDFDNEGASTIYVSIDVASDDPSTITIAYEQPASRGIPASAVSFEKTVEIAADKTEAKIGVEVDLTALSETGPLTGNFKISAVSDNLDFDSEAVEAELPFALPTRVSSWTGSYWGPYVYNGKTYTTVIANGMADDQFFDLFVSKAGTYPEDNTLSTLFLDDADEIQYYMQRYSLDDLIYQGPGAYFLNKLEPGEYEIHIIGFDDKGNATGQYSKFSFEIEEDPEPSEAYAKWLGDWTLADGTKITISTSVLEEAYIVEGLEGVSGVNSGGSVIADFDAKTGNISISAQELGTWNHATYGEATDRLIGRCIVGGYYVSLTGGVICTGTIDSNGNGVLTPGTYYDSDAGSVYTIVGMKLVAVVSAGTMQYSSSFTTLPNTLTKVTSDEEVEASVSALPGMTRYLKPVSSVRSHANVSLGPVEWVD